ncbi:MarR family winged helix-turn-helix transcriptional regulator [Sphingomonas bacterium]|uniref:MarR family winged helix-turn-helix transcriptional regulator n=1 Tax=Sphingomonas bacterium TaxID=1895847 RepID=UPI0015768275|nr:MarR family winged helix-turn-helix transcriptional regulator [Sphingomonas bacterium]
MIDEITAERLKRFELLDAPGHLLRRNHQRSLEIFTRHVGDDVTRQQIALLIALAQRDTSSQRDLVEATGIDKSTLKEMLDRMIGRGWVLRERHPIDSRAWAMRITASGTTMLHDRIDRIEAAQREIIAPLSVADQRLFMRCLRTLIGRGSSNAEADQSDASLPISPE